MVEVRVVSAAQRDYAEALKWYAERSVAAADRFDAAVDAAMRSIAEHPERYPRCDDRHQFFLLSYFPYQIVYLHQDAVVYVVAIAHTAREPRYWSQR